MTTIERRISRPLAPKVKVLWLMSWVAGFVFFMVVAFLIQELTLPKSEIQFLKKLPDGVVPAVFFLVFNLPGLILLPKRYARWSYSIDQQQIFVEYGVVTHTKKVVPLKRIQYVEIQSGPLQRSFGIATITAYTAGLDNKVFEIPGIEIERAEELRKEIMKLRTTEAGL